jgi:ATP-dependent DNA ligase
MRAGSVHSALGRAEWAQLHERKTKVPAGPDWLHEIKHDGYRLIAQRDARTHPG